MHRGSLKKVVFSMVAALIVACLAVTISAGASDSIPGRIDIRIGSVDRIYQGQQVSIPITVTAGSYSIGGFQFLVGWNSQALHLDGVRPGLLCQLGTGEFGYFDVTCDQVGLPAVEDVRGDRSLTGFAEIMSTEFHKSPDTTLGLRATVTTADTLCFLEFYTPNNRLFEGSMHHIQFVWHDCADNLIRSYTGDTVHLAGRAYYETDSGKIVEMASSASLPTIGGPTDSCIVHLARSQSSNMLMKTHYFNGQVSISGPSTIDARGDLNLDGIANDAADAELFARYFVCRDSVFLINAQGQIAASDVNKDGVVLTLEDFVYLQSIIRGDDLNSTAPYSKNSALFSHDSATSEVSLSTGDSLGVALLLFVGDSAPTLLDDNLEMVYCSDRSVTRVLLWPKMGHWIVGGPLLRSDGDLVHVDALTGLGGAIRTETK